MVTEQELQELERQAQEVQRQRLPRRRFGSGYDVRQRQQDIIEQRKYGKKYVQQIQAQRQRLEQYKSDQAEYERQKALIEYQNKPVELALKQLRSGTTTIDSGDLRRLTPEQQKVYEDILSEASSSEVYGSIAEKYYKSAVEKIRRREFEATLPEGVYGFTTPEGIVYGEIGTSKPPTVTTSAYDNPFTYTQPIPSSNIRAIDQPQTFHSTISDERTLFNIPSTRQPTGVRRETGDIQPTEFEMGTVATQPYYIERQVGTFTRGTKTVPVTETYYIDPFGTKTGYGATTKERVATFEEKKSYRELTSEVKTGEKSIFQPVKDIYYTFKEGYEAKEAEIGKGTIEPITKYPKQIIEKGFDVGIVGFETYRIKPVVEFEKGAVVGTIEDIEKRPLRNVVIAGAGVAGGYVTTAGLKGASLLGKTVERASKIAVVGTGVASVGVATAYTGARIYLEPTAKGRGQIVGTSVKDLALITGGFSVGAKGYYKTEEFFTKDIETVYKFGAEVKPTTEGVKVKVYQEAVKGNKRVQAQAQQNLKEINDKFYAGGGTAQVFEKATGQVKVSKIYRLGAGVEETGTARLVREYNKYLSTPELDISAKASKDIGIGLRSAGVYKEKQLIEIKKGLYFPATKSGESKAVVKITDLPRTELEKVSLYKTEGLGVVTKASDYSYIYTGIADKTPEIFKVIRIGKRTGRIEEITRAKLKVQDINVGGFIKFPEPKPTEEPFKVFGTSLKSLQTKTKPFTETQKQEIVKKTVDIATSLTKITGDALKTKTPTPTTPKTPVVTTPVKTTGETSFKQVKLVSGGIPTGRFKDLTGMGKIGGLGVTSKFGDLGTFEGRFSTKTSEVVKSKFESKLKTSELLKQQSKEKLKLQEKLVQQEVSRTKLRQLATVKLAQAQREKLKLKAVTKQITKVPIPTPVPVKLTTPKKTGGFFYFKLPYKRFRSKDEEERIKNNDLLIVEGFTGKTLGIRRAIKQKDLLKEASRTYTGIGIRGTPTVLK